MTVFGLQHMCLAGQFIKNSAHCCVFLVQMSSDQPPRSPPLSLSVTTCRPSLSDMYFFGGGMSMQTEVGFKMLEWAHNHPCSQARCVCVCVLTMMSGKGSLSHLSSQL